MIFKKCIYCQCSIPLNEWITAFYEFGMMCPHCLKIEGQEKEEEE